MNWHLFDENTIDLLWKIHWNTKTCKYEEISSVVDMLWTNEFNLYKNGDQGRSCAKVLLFNNVEKKSGRPPANNHVDQTLTVKASCTVRVILQYQRMPGKNELL